MLNRNFILFALTASMIIIGCKKPSTTPVFDTSAQAVTDDALLEKYFKEHSITVTKASLGYYYHITDSLRQPDSVLQAKIGRTAFLRYKGRLLTNTVFDSNTTSATALIFTVGSGKVIAGLDSAIQHFRKGETGTVYLPSRLGYGNYSQSVIPANSCLIFEINKLNVE